MSANPVGVPEFLYRKMRPTTTVSTTEIEQAIRDLDAHAFTKREEANGVLKRVGKHAEQKLRDNLKQRAYSLESSRRAQKLLALIDREGIRETRAIEALERIGNKCAVAVMQDLAREWAGSSLEKEIGLSLKRMTKENCPHKSK